ncbi:16S rRNA (cytidine(1402)-2'-O)-methyltransferase [Gammaproteobacteria bacterium 45_16_T64]|mgnify:CR=1 FL=1|nr:16S rRNA (cytidine(1402)-2'-O)-methyltransferase [Gammaproteobacteria bacterium 45_16_T64]
MNIGNLYIVATPIGNLSDITLRALETLKSVDIVAAEDTRHSRKLFNAHNIETALWAVHEHNEDAKSNALVEKLLSGKSVALISDAGTPLISDPGYRVVTRAREAGIQVYTIPGPCAAIAALSVSGLGTDRFLFVGFLAPKTSARQKQLQEFVDERATLIVYESPRRVLGLLADILEVMGADKVVCLAKELTKTYETVLSGPVDSLLEQVHANPDLQRGEFVVLISGVSKKQHDEQLVDGKTLAWVGMAQQHLPLKKACALVSEMTGVKKNLLYKAALKGKEPSGDS